MDERRFIAIKEFIEIAPFGRDRCYALAKTAGFGIRDRNKWFVDLLAYEQWMEAQRGTIRWNDSTGLTSLAQNKQRYFHRGGNQASIAHFRCSKGLPRHARDCGNAML